MKLPFEGRSDLLSSWQALQRENHPDWPTCSWCAGSGYADYAAVACENCGGWGIVPPPPSSSEALKSLGEALVVPYVKGAIRVMRFTSRMLKKLDGK